MRDVAARHGVRCGDVQTSEFGYALPEAAIAQSAIEPRDASRLLVAQTLEDRRFTDLPTLLRPGDLLVVNRTRVRAARIHGVKADSGGRVELLLTKRIDADRWEALVKPARRVRPGTQLRFGPLRGEVLAGPDRGVVTIKLTGDIEVEEALHDIGDVPLPPYFHGSLPNPDRYQTMFAKEIGSAAAPTAALHFTPGLVKSLEATGIETTEVELEVGLDTFRPMAEGDLEDHVMHSERFVVPEEAAAAVDATRRHGGRVVAVGTTVVRTLESVASPSGQVEAKSGDTRLFIRPGHEFAVVDALITNFHAPRTSLLVLIAAAMGERWRHAYTHALEHGYRFLSFGDAMLIEEVRRR